MIAISGCLRFTPVVAAGITLVGSTQASAQTSSSAPPVVCALPAGCVAGDAVVLSCQAVNAGGFQWQVPVGSTAVLASTVVDGTSSMVCAVFARTLVQADVDVGTLEVHYTQTQAIVLSTIIAVDAYRSVGSQLIDVVGVLSTGTVASGTAIIATAPSITTTADGDLLQYTLFKSGGGQTISPPAGWASRLTPTPPTGYMVQAAKGPTGDITVSVEFGFNQTGAGYGVLLLSLRKRDTTFRLLGTLPTGTVGQPWTGTLTFAGDFTAPITIDASTGTIPAWMGAPTIDYTAKTVMWSGTPDTETEYDFTPRATDANAQAAVGAAQSVAIAAASTAPVLVQQAVSKGTSIGTVDIVLPTAPTQGNTLAMMLVSTNTSWTPPDIAGWAKVETNMATRPTALYTKSASASESSTITTPSFPSGSSSGMVQEWAGTVTVALGDFGSSVQSGTDLSVGPLAAPAARATPVIFGYYTSNSSLSLTWPAAWTSVGPVPNGSFPSRGGSVAASAPTAAAVPAVPITGTTRGDTRTFVWRGMWVSKS